MTKTQIIKDGDRWAVIVRHPEAEAYSVSCATREQAETVAFRAEHN